MLRSRGFNSLLSCFSAKSSGILYRVATTSVVPFSTSSPFSPEKKNTDEANQREQELFSKIFESILNTSSERNGEARTGLNKRSVRSNELGDDASSDFQALLEGLGTNPAKNKKDDASAFLIANKPVTDISLASDFRKKQAKDAIDRLKELETNEQVWRFFEEEVLHRWDDISSKNRLKLRIDSAVVISAILATCIKDLAYSFKLPQEALAMFETVKRHSIDMYAAICNVAVYNEILLIRWRCYQDLQSVEAVLKEMKVNAVSQNSDTLTILREICNSALDRSHGNNGIAGNDTVLWWNMEDEKRLERLQRLSLQLEEFLESGEMMSL